MGKTQIGFDYKLFLEFVDGVRKDFVEVNGSPLPVGSREEDSSLYTVPDDYQLLFSVSN